jgi:glycosyltransferase involved in cell wall biosynthesis
MIATPVRPRLVYICLQQTVEGQASHAHVHEIIGGLERRGWQVDLREIHADRSRDHGRLYYLWHYLKPQFGLWLRPGGRASAVYIRADALALPSFLWSRLRRIPVVQEVNGPYNDRVVGKPWLKPFVRVLSALQRYQYRRSAKLIAVTPQLSQWLSGEAPGRPVTLVPNGANTELFRPQAVTAVPLPKRYVALVGLLARWQGIPLLLAAARDPAWPEGVSVVIAGSGDARRLVESAARENPRIEYLGVVPYREVPGILAGSLAGLSLKTTVPGKTETGMSPLKLYETLAVGVPAIVTDYHGQAEVVRAHQCGLIIPQDDPAALARAVARIASNEAERKEWGKRGLEAVRDQHSWDQRAETIDQLLRTLP